MDLFDNKKFVDYVIILFLDAPNKGHWTTLLKMGDDKKCVLEFFDSYGNPPEKVYKFCPMKTRKLLGTEKNKLNELLNKTGDNIDNVFLDMVFQIMDKHQINIQNSDAKKIYVSNKIENKKCQC